MIRTHTSNIWTGAKCSAFSTNLLAYSKSRTHTLNDHTIKLLTYAQTEANETVSLVQVALNAIQPANHLTSHL